MLDYYVIPVLHLCMYTSLPFICLLTCDIILSLTLLQASSFFPQTVNDRRRSTNRSTIIMVLTVSFTFLLLTLPERIFLSIFSFSHFSGRADESNAFTIWIGKIKAFYKISQTLLLINSAINFFLYCLTGRRLRKEFVSCICGCRNYPSSSRTQVLNASAGPSTTKGGSK